MQASCDPGSSGYCDSLGRSSGLVRDRRDAFGRSHDQSLGQGELQAGGQQQARYHDRANLRSRYSNRDGDVGASSDRDWRADGCCDRDDR